MGVKINKIRAEPDFTLGVYPSRRSGSAPEVVEVLILKYQNDW